MQKRLLEKAQSIKAHPAAFRQALTGRCLGMLFEKSSTRTRVSFEAGMHQLGGHAIFLHSRDHQMGRGESLADTAQVLSRYVHILSIRAHTHNTVQTLAAHSRVPVINALDDLWHPCQALADLFTLQEHHAGLAGQQLVYVGDGNNVAHSLLAAGALAGVHVRLICPENFGPNVAILARCRAAATPTGARLEVMHDVQSGVVGADAVYTDVWTSMGQEAEQVERRAAFKGFTVTPQVMRQARPEAIFLHCLPVHRGEEVDAAVIDGPQSRVFDQAENRLHVQKALMLYLLGHFEKV